MTYVQKDYNLPNIWYADLWPLSSPMMVIQSYEAAVESNNMAKHHRMGDGLDHIVGKQSMISINGTTWKRWRQIFNPGFSSAHLMSIVPIVLEDMLTFVDILEEHAQKREVFRLEEAATRLTVDVIGRVVLDIPFGTQRGDHELFDALVGQIRMTGLKTEWTISRIDPITQTKSWLNQRRMNKYIGKVLDERFSQHKPTEKKSRKKTIIDLALDSYIEETGTTKMDATFRESAISQIKSFLFAGHDTTATLIAYAIHLLSRSPDALRSIREEHDAVLGPDPLAASTAIRDEATLLSQLKYTHAVIKETLRLYPPANTLLRASEKGFFFKDAETGTVHDPEGFMIFPPTIHLQRAEEYWGPTANQFRPERWLPNSGYPVVPKAWRAFGDGNRNCIGQELAVIEAKITLSLVMRRFEFKATLEPEDLRHLENDGTVYSREKYGSKVKHADDDNQEFFQVLLTTGKPRQGLPMRVSRVNDETKEK